MKHSVAVATFPYGGTISNHTSEWIARLFFAIRRDPRVGECREVSVADTPITMTRNRVIKSALAQGIDWVLMVDSDMKPDLYVGQPGAKPFWESSWEFAVNHHGPLCIAAPYCGPPPVENVYVFRWSNQQSDDPNTNLQLEQFTRDDAAFRCGIERVAALPTGVFLCRTDAFTKIKPPWFDYEYKDPPYNTEKASTEDVFATRNLDLAGVPQYCNWDAWAGHVKQKVVGKPVMLTSDQVRDQFFEALSRGPQRRERLVEVGPNGVRLDEL